MTRKLSLDELRALREEKRRDLHWRDTVGKTATVIIGMGTCGIAAGARGAFQAFVDELDKQNQGHVTVKQTGCMGLCFSEPTVEVVVPGMPDVVYGRVSAEVARRIVQEHIIGGRLVDDHIYDKPAADLLEDPRAESK